MKINFKLRLQNKTVLLALITCASTFFYQVLGILGITTPVTEDMVAQLVSAALNVLVAVGVLVDPTTRGVGDSKRAQEYNKLQ